MPSALHASSARESQAAGVLAIPWNSSYNSCRMSGELEIAQKQYGHLVNKT